MESHTQDVQEFTSSFGRLARREEIGRQIANKENSGLRNVIDSTKKHLPVIEAQVNQLVNEEFAIEPERFEIVTLFSEALREKFPNIEGLAVLPFGSMIMGGAVARKVMGNDEYSTDLDWGIISNNTLSKTQLQEINEFAKQSIPTVAQAEGLPPTISSSYINSEHFNVCNLKNKDEALDLINQMEKDESDWDPWTNPLLMYLEPSVPPKYNIKNREYLLAALSELATTNHGLWEQTVDQLTDSYKQHLRIKPKHLKSVHTNSTKDGSLKKTVIALSRDARAENMEKLLLATDVIKQKV